MRRIALIALVGALALVAAPAGASHCQLIQVFQGPTSAAAHRGVDTGFSGCALDSQNESYNTNLVIPGAAYAFAAVVDPLVPTGGTLTIGTQTTSLTWTHNVLQGRWESQDVAMQFNTAIVATAALSGGSSITVRYRPAGS